MTGSGANANKVVTIDPSANLPDGVVYVAASNAFYDAQGNQGAAANTTFTIDSRSPTVSDTWVSGNTLTVVFSETMNSAKVAANNRWSIREGKGGYYRTVSSQSLSGNRLTLTLDQSISSGEPVTLSYGRHSDTERGLRGPGGQHPERLRLHRRGQRRADGEVGGQRLLRRRRAQPVAYRAGERGHGHLREGRVQREREPPWRGQATTRSPISVM